MTLTPEEIKAMEDEVNALDNFGGATEPEPEPEPSPAVEPEAAAEPEPAPQPEPELSPAPPVTPEPVAANAQPAPPADDAQATIDALREQINQLNGMLLDLKSGKTGSPEAPKPKDTPAPPAVPAPPQPQSSPAEPIDFVGEIDMDDLTADPRVLNQVLNAVVAKASERSVQRAVEETLRGLPQIVTAQYQQQSYIDRTVKVFYDENPDLASVKQTVAQVAMNVAAEHPEYNVEQLYKEAATKTRELLKLPAFQKPAAPSNNPKEFSNPAFAAKPSIRQTPAKVSALQAEIDAL